MSRVAQVTSVRFGLWIRKVGWRGGAWLSLTIRLMKIERIVKWGNTTHEACF